MRMQDLTIMYAHRGGVYTHIHSVEDFENFFSLCVKYHPKCYRYSHNASSYYPSESNIQEYIKNGCIAYVSGRTGVVGISPIARLHEFMNYEKLTSNRQVLHNLIQSRKGI